MQLSELESLGRSRLRFVQFEGRRRAIRIEEAYWQCLEEAAEEQGLRLNHLVDAIARSHPDTNLSALLRLFCVRRLMAQIRRERLTARALNLTTILDCCPSPAFAISRNQVIDYANAALRAWVTVGTAVGTAGAGPAEGAGPRDGSGGEAREEPGAVQGAHLNRFFRLKLRVPLADLWLRADLFGHQALTGTIAHMAPGSLKVRPIKATLIDAGDDRPQCLAVFIQ